MTAPSPARVLAEQRLRGDAPVSAAAFAFRKQMNG
jgi:hypothetical protein